MQDAHHEFLGTLVGEESSRILEIQNAVEAVRNWYNHRGICSQWSG